MARRTLPRVTGSILSIDGLCTGKVSYGVGVERTFPVHSPSIDKIEPVTRGKVRRAKLYYLRDLRGKAARIKERRDQTGS